MNVLEIIKRATARISSAVNSGQRIAGLHRVDDGSRSLKLVELEERIMLSATPVAAVMVEQSAALVPESGDAPSQEEVSTQSGDAATQSDTTIARELVFIDASVEDYQQLLDDLWANDDPNRNIDVVLLSSQRDGIEQITETLAQYSDQKLDAVHFISHGTDRAIKLGNDWLDAAAFTENEQLIESWSHALNEGADLLFYGCDLASDEQGRKLLESIANATGADLAASIDDTGTVLLGGDWDLEYELGEIDTEVAISELTQQDYDAILNTFTVTNTDDSGAGSLRQAITDANNLAGFDTITFNITGTGVHTIGLLSDLPAISDAVLIDGWSDPNFVDTPVIELSGNGISTTNGFWVTGSNVTIRGFIINGFTDNGVYLQGAGGNTVVGNWIGTDDTGNALTEPTGGYLVGVHIRSGNNRIGGTTSQERNVIGGADEGIRMRDAASTGNIIQGNYIGVGLDGSSNIGNSDDGIDIGTAAADNLIGGYVASAGNIIANNGGNGVEVRLDADTGPNNQQNFPVLTSASTDGSGTVAISGAINTHAYTSLRVEFFAEFGGTATYLGYANVTTNSQGDATFLKTFNTVVPAGATLSTTATNLVTGDTSEFSGTVAAASAVIVDTTVDLNDSGIVPGNASHTVTWLLNNKGADGKISLREALIATNNTAGPNTIFLGPGNHQLTLSGASEDFSASSDLDIRGNTTLIGASTSSTSITGTGTQRVLHLLNGASAYIANLTITGGSTDAGAGIKVDSGSLLELTNVVISNNISTTGGGGINNEGTVYIDSSTISGNTTGGVDTGGGIRNLGSLYISNSTLTNNSSSAGGAIRSTAGSVTEIYNSTISGNSAINGAGASLVGTNRIRSVTFANNSGSSTLQVSGTTLVGSSIFEVVTGSAVSGTVTSSGYNIIEDGSGSGWNGNDLQNTNPLLNPLSDNGGPTLTHSLQSTSPAINAGDPASLIVTDQRGEVRNVGYADIGAFEAPAETLVNQTTTGAQTTDLRKNVATDADGNFVIVWESNDGDQGGIWARRYDKDGNPLSNEFLVNSTSTGNQFDPSVAMDDAGNFIVVWNGNGPGDVDGIFAQHYDSNGVAQGSEFRVNSVTAGVQSSPAVGANPTGGYVIAWSDGSTLYNYSIAANGSFIGDDTVAGTSIQNIEVAVAADGSHVIVYEDFGRAAAMLYDDTGAQVTTVPVVAGGIYDDFTPISVAMMPSGEFVIAWEAYDLFFDNITDIAYQRYDKDGNVISGLQAFAAPAGTPSVAVDDLGNVIITYTKSGDVWRRVFDSNDKAVGGAIRVNTTSTGTQLNASVATAKNGDHVIVWSGNGEGDADGVFFRTFAGFDGLVGHYKLDEGSGTTAIDSSVYGANGTHIGSPVYESGIESTGVNYSGDFDRTEIADPADGHLDFGSGDFAVSFWLNSLQTSGSARLVGKTAGAAGFIFYRTNGDLIFEVNDGTTLAQMTATDVMDGAWHHVVGVREGNDFTLYIDGVAVSTDTAVIGSIDNSEALLFGASSGSTSPLTLEQWGNTI